jgi:hypothetical protein
VARRLGLAQRSSGHSAGGRGQRKGRHAGKQTEEKRGKPNRIQGVRRRVLKYMFGYLKSVEREGGTEGEGTSTVYRKEVDARRRRQPASTQARRVARDGGNEGRRAAVRRRARCGPNKNKSATV